jgi:PrcB C-terminal
VTAVVAVVGVLVAARLLREGESRPVAWRDLTEQIGPLRISDREHRLFREQDELDRYLVRARARGETPQIDFARRELLLVSPGPRSSTGYEVEVLSVREQGGEITVRVRERTPTLQDRVDAHVTHPYRLLSLPAGKEVAVDWLGR